MEASAQCQFDFLEINNVRLCGSLAHETTRTYIFEGKEKLIRFHSDASTSRSGFLIRVDQLECDGEMIIRPPPHAVFSAPPVLPPVLAVSHKPSRTDRPSLGPGSQAIPSLTTARSCNQFFMSHEFEIRSPSFPFARHSSSTSSRETECMYYIKKHEASVCRLEVSELPSI